MLEGVDINALIALVGVGISGGGVGAWWSRRTAVDKIAADASTQIRDALRERVSELEAAATKKDARNDELTLEAGELRGAKLALEGAVEVLREQLATRTEERDQARSEREEAREKLAEEILEHAITRADRERLKLERQRAADGLVTAAHQEPSVRHIAEAVIPGADEAHSLAGLLEQGPTGEELHSLSEPSDTEDA